MKSVISSIRRWLPARSPDKVVSAPYKENNYSDIKQQLETLSLHFKGVREFREIMEEEGKYLFALSGSAPENILRRIITRSLFSIGEGNLWITKQTILACSCPVFLNTDPPQQVAGFSLTEAERDLLNDKERRLNKKGVQEPSQARITLEANIRFTFALAERVITNGSFQPDYSGSGWRDLWVGVSVRDRITHPKEVSSLNVSESEFNAAAYGFIWLMKTCGDAQNLLYQQNHAGYEKYLEHQHSYRQQLEAEVKSQQAEAENEKAEVERLEAEVKSQQAEAKRLEAEVERKEAEVARLEAEVEMRRAVNEKLSRKGGTA